MGTELRSDKYTPEEIFRVIDNQSVSVREGELIIQHYGDRRVMEAIADLQERMGIELNEEMGEKIIHIEQLIDAFYEKAIAICPPERRNSKK
jgi:hypothetical protein